MGHESWASCTACAPASAVCNPPNPQLEKTNIPRKVERSHSKTATEKTPVGGVLCLPLAPFPCVAHTLADR